MPQNIAPRGTAPQASKTRSTPLFELNNASLSHGQTQVLHDINLTINFGERVALLGPSGAGKSSLLNLLYEQQPEQTALCPQDNGLVDILSAYHNVFMGGLERYSAPAALWNLIRPVTSARTEIEAIAVRLGLADELWKSVDRLSGGQRQRVALGRALFRHQPVFLGDEPVSALDPVQAEALLNDVLTQHSTSIVCLHSPALALALFDRVILMKSGNIELDTSSERLSLEQLQSLYGDVFSEAGSFSVSTQSNCIVSSSEACVTGKIISPHTDFTSLPTNQIQR